MAIERESRVRGDFGGCFCRNFSSRKYVAIERESKVRGDFGGCNVSREI